MLLGFLTFLIMIIVAYVYWREGVLTAVTMTINVVLAGLVAFNFWEPLADLLEPPLTGTFLEHYEDAFCLVAIFSLTLGLLRWATNSLSRTQLTYNEYLTRIGSVVSGLVTGYLVAGFLTCVLQTLPWAENFLNFEYRFESNQTESALRAVMPPDRVWLAMMRYAGAYPLAGAVTTRPVDEEVGEPQSAYDRYDTFDKYATFELRYGRYRRYQENAEGPRQYHGELNKELNRPPP